MTANDFILNGCNEALDSGNKRLFAELCNVLKATNMADKPMRAIIHNMFGRAAMLNGEYYAAKGEFDVAYDLSKDPLTLVNGAIARFKLGEHKEAIHLCTAVSSFSGAILQLAAMYEEMGFYELALKWSKRRGDDKRFNRQLEFAEACDSMRLNRGRAESGRVFDLYESRPTAISIRSAMDIYPEWGGNSKVESLLVIGEGGIGDQIMFGRYLPLAKKFCDKLTFMTRPELARLFWKFNPITTNPDKEFLDKMSAWVPLQTLASVFRNYNDDHSEDEVSIRMMDHYLRMFNLKDTDRTPTGSLRIGICWKGNANHTRDRSRSFKFNEFESIVKEVSKAFPDATFYSLQKWDVESSLPGINHCHDFMDVSHYIINNLDAVITVDTAIAHLSAAIGIPTFMLVRTPIEWRWGIDKNGYRGEWYTDSLTVLHVRNNVFDVIPNIIESLKTVDVEVLKNKDKDETGLVLSEPKEISVNTESGSMMFKTDDPYVGRSLGLYGEWLSDEEKLIRTLCDAPSDGYRASVSILEIGAGIGAHTIPLAFRCGRVVAHVKESETLHLLRNVHTNGFTGTVTICHGELSITIKIADFPTVIKINSCSNIIFNEVLKSLNGKSFVYVRNADAIGESDLIKLSEIGYRLYKCTIPLYNPNNFYSNPINVFGSECVSSLVCVPGGSSVDLKLIDGFNLDRITLQ